MSESEKVYIKKDTGEYYVRSDIVNDIEKEINQLKQENVELKENHYHYPHCNASRKYEIGCEGCSCPPINYNQVINQFKQENTQLKSELRKWQNLNIENLNGVKEQYYGNKNSLACASAYINGLEHTLQHCQEALRKCEIISNNVLYFDDNSDYSTALWQILNITQGRKATDDCYDVVLKYIEGEDVK